MAYTKFKGFLAENEIKHKEVADLIDVTVSNFSKKINRKGEDFTKDQIKIMCDTYHLNANEFFLI